MAKRKSTSSPTQYSAPALEKGLDILELLADQAEGISQAGIARRLERSTSVIFRMLDSLQRRGYIHRDPRDDLYRLTSRLFEMAHRHPPTKRLLETALPIMRQLAETTSQSCHLSECHDGALLVLSEVRCPGFIGFSVRAGTRVPLSTNASGMVLLAYQPDGTRKEWLENSEEKFSKAELTQLGTRLKTIRRNGYEQRPSHYIKGVSDLSCPITDHQENAIAAITVPYMVRYGQEMNMKEVRSLLIEAAASISSSLGRSI